MYDKRIDAYIARSAEFARPILIHLRELIHKGCPEVVETIKWGFPHFDHHGIMASMAAFKQHCTFGFWKESLMSDPHKLFGKNKNEAMGSLGQIKTLADLPADKILIEYAHEAARLNKEGIKVSKATSPSSKTPKLPKIPNNFMAAIRQNKQAQETYENFSNTNKKEYIEWIIEAKSEETRTRRMETAIAQMAEGKIRHWKYVK